MTSVLISGASVAGPALAYWLHQYGFEVTVVEKSGSIRGGGYPIDIRGTAVDVVERMGVLPQVRAAHIATRRISVTDGAGRTIAAFSPDDITGGRPGADLELPRGDLTSILYAQTRDKVDYVFGDSIAALGPHDGGVDVTFEHGRPRTFDYVAGADGLHSNTRRLAFGPESDYHHYLGSCFAGFTAPNTGAWSHEAILQNTPGTMAAVYAVGEHPWVHALLAFATPKPPADTTDRVALVTKAFAGQTGEVPALLDTLAGANDLYFDTVSQIRMPGWVAGRVALVGDAAYAPSFLSGQGTSLALTGAYVLACELRNGTPATYAATMRAYVTRNQALATGGIGILPRTRRQLWMRNQAFRLLPLLARTDLLGRGQRRAAKSLTLPPR
ncbi:FAD-dependent monooxygenase [Amorphoplanes digitatis]|uniref:2-polyprenyl-6-methoxyphenol hydroxylase-like FAD-dependent oxidoreductase n=1 Tax=Actinoplanes digitatis TaxID=1868 RepID=A0A7W7MT71_9ACTN|nr:FAD-dependent monooxygenase [Actinoplanes digitatis]MBB4765289.1 2-polyprenyl-6-methoxyphenol hydroxylase-like FAD-dependent oxidoreductase [Actinoplanes digitatis]GID95064.1 oxidoreductase [Actinoplanes digitatis]